jgi:hypothetical protein
MRIGWIGGDAGEPRAASFREPFRALWPAFPSVLNRFRIDPSSSQLGMMADGDEPYDAQGKHPGGAGACAKIRRFGARVLA